MKLIPKKIQNEEEKLLPLVLEKLSDSNKKGEEIKWGDVVNEVIEQYGSTELKAFHAYCKRIGDEHQLREKDGSYLRDKNGNMIQTWTNSEDGFVRDIYGHQICYKDGAPVPNVECPEIIRCLYDEEHGMNNDERLY